MPSADIRLSRRSKLPRVPQAGFNTPSDSNSDFATGTHVDSLYAKPKPSQGRTLQVNVFAQDDSESSRDTGEVTTPLLSSQQSYPLGNFAEDNEEKAEALGQITASPSDSVPDWVSQAAPDSSLNKPIVAFVERAEGDNSKVDNGTIERAYGEATSQPLSNARIEDTADAKEALAKTAPQVRGSPSRIGTEHQTLELNHVAPACAHDTLAVCLKFR